jgi:hypothetical protein
MLCYAMRRATTFEPAGFDIELTRWIYKSASSVAASALPGMLPDSGQSQGSCMAPGEVWRGNVEIHGHKQTDTPLFHCVRCSTGARGVEESLKGVVEFPHGAYRRESDAE